MGAIQSPYPPLVAVPQTTPVTVTGTTTETAVQPGPTIAAGGNYAGLWWAFEGAGLVTTTADTQTVTVNIRLGGLGGTLLLSMSINPNSSGTTTNAYFGFTGYVIFNSPTQATCKMQVDANYFPNSVNSNKVAVTNTSAQQLVLSFTPSDPAMSLTINGGGWNQVR